MSCYQAGCLEPGREHALAHYHTYETHPIALNIQRKRKERAEKTVRTRPSHIARTTKPYQEEQPHDVLTKLAISAEADADRYDYLTTVKCYACQTELPLTKEIEGVVETVMKSLSSAQQSEVKAWEQEMIACEHTLTLQQDSSRRLENQNLATCSKCELNENLWLCLVCGALSCGRAQFGGGGGNGHGLQHVESTGHSLAVKLGSITPEGTADVYCYACDEERIDPMLQEHLLNWDIKLADRTKTERSLQEMQIEQNMKWEFSMTSEDGQQMTPLFGPGFTGMKNIGNSCYLASIMQCLFSLPEFDRRFREPFEADRNSVVNNPGEDLEVQMRKLADGLLSGNFSKPISAGGDENEHQYGIAPSMIKSLLGRGHSEFSTMRQQDAFEFLLYLIEKLNTISPPANYRNPVDSFKFQVEQRTQCLSCQKVAYKTTEQDNISILVPAHKIASSNAEDAIKYESVSITDLLDLFTAEERVDYTCGSCSSKAGVKKHTRFKSFPDTLVLNPGRFALENWVPIKLEIPVSIPEGGFSLDQYLATGLQPGEELLPADDISQAESPKATEAEVEQLMAMGFPRVRAEKALLITNAGPEVAMDWLFAHMEDIDIDEPYVPSQKSSSKADKSADSGIVSALMDMGFPQVRCQKATLATGNSGVEAAMDWLMQHMEDSDIDEPIASTPTEVTTRDAGVAAEIGSTELPAHYVAKAMACHKGSSIHAGHYVAFVKRQVDGIDDWVLYNDEKVLRGVDWVEASKTAYVYFFEKVKH